MTPGAVRATAHVIVSLDGNGRARAPRLRSDPPLVLRRTAPDTVHLVSVGGGPVAGDHLALRVRVEAGARLTVRQLAAAVALPSPRGDEPSRLLLDLAVADGAHLDWWGEPTVAAAGCHHETHISIDLHGDASLRLREEIIAGRHGEIGGRARSRVTVHRDGQVLLRTDDTVGGPHWTSAAVGGGARNYGTAIVAGTDAGAVPIVTPDGPGATTTATTFHLDDRLAVVSALGAAHPEVRAVLDAAVTWERSTGTDQVR